MSARRKMNDDDRRGVRKVLSLFDEESLREINKMVVAEIRESMRKKALVDAKKYRPGMKVKFEGRSGRTIEGVVERVNQKTLTIKTDGPFGYPEKWRVGYGFVEVA